MRFLSLCAYRGMADCNSPRMCPRFVGAFRVNSFSTEFSSGSSSRRARTTITTKSNSDPKDRYLLISEFDSLYPTPHPVPERELSAPGSNRLNLGLRFSRPENTVFQGLASQG